MVNLKFALLPPDALKPDPRNARTHPKRQVAQIAASISATTFANPILVDEDKVIIAGHGRLLAAKSLSLAEVPVIIVPGLSEVQKRALRLADNKIALGAGWDRDLLRLELKEIEIAGYDVELTGFNMGEIDAMRVVGDPDDEVIPETPSRATSKPGDIFIAGPHRIGCGDVRDLPFLAKVMDGALADTAQLDPPYNVNVSRYATGGGKVKHADFAVAAGEMDSAQFKAFLEDCLGACASVSRQGAVHYVWMDHYHLGELMAAGDAVYDTRLNIAVWVKSNAGMGSLYRSQHELCCIYRVGSAKNRNNVHLGKHGRSRTNVWNYGSVSAFGGSRRAELELHPTTKPTRAIADAIMDVTASGEIVLDGFLGSGTSLIAAEQTKRRFRGLDIEPRYVDVALQRWSEMTGQEPILEATGETFRSVQIRREPENTQVRAEEGIAA
jgi:DNA modification methylase